ncbi:MAG: hypothetical protein ACSHX8_00280 [Opitutaceae bacterium]
MKSFSQYSPLEAIADGICSPVKGAIIAMIFILLGFGFGTFFALIPEIQINDAAGIFMHCIWFSPLSFAASTLAVIVVPWSFLLKAGYTVSTIIFFTSNAPKTKMGMLPVIFLFALSDGILFTRFIQ